MLILINFPELRFAYIHIACCFFRLSGYMVLRIVQALRFMRVQTPVTVNELTLDPNDKLLSERKRFRVLSSLAILLRLWTVQCLNLTEYKMESVSLSVLLCHQGPLTLRYNTIRHISAVFDFKFIMT